MNVNEDDRALMRQYQSGDQIAFAELEKRYSRPLAVLFYRWLSLRNFSDARDLVQDTWMQVAKSKGRYDPSKGSVKTWIYSIALHLKNDELARQYNAAAVDFEIEVDQAQPTDFEERILTKIAVHEALLKLTPQQRLLIWLADVEGFRCGEIARISGDNEEAVKTRLRRVRKALLRLVFVAHGTEQVWTT